MDKRSPIMSASHFRLDATKPTLGVVHLVNRWFLTRYQID